MSELKTTFVGLDEDEVAAIFVAGEWITDILDSGAVEEDPEMSHVAQVLERLADRTVDAEGVDAIPGLLGLITIREGERLERVVKQVATEIVDTIRPGGNRDHEMDVTVVKAILMESLIPDHYRMNGQGEL